MSMMGTVEGRVGVESRIGVETKNMLGMDDRKPLYMFFSVADDP
jgi:hypothetical protein